MHELIGVDTGGTFTDFILYKNGSFVSYKIPSTPEAPELAIIQGFNTLTSMLEHAHIVHGTTVATNTLLEGNGAKTAFVTNNGLKDILRIGRQARAQLYSLCPQATRMLIEEHCCFELDARVDAHGQALKTVALSQMQALKAKLLAQGFESVAICMLFSFLNDHDECALEDVLQDDFFVSRSSQILPEQREYERAVVTWLNSYLGPKTQSYLNRLQSQLSCPIHVMQSDATTLPAEHAGGQAVRLLLSGPAGGVMAANVIAKKCMQTKLLTLDMGGTSTDVSLIDQQVKLTNDAHIAEFPLAISLLDIHTIGAGGGSLARVDDASGLHVGPQSAGAEPGPACYGHGGQQATITDANVVLGKLPTLHPWESGLHLDKQRAEEALMSIASQLDCTQYEAAQGIIDIANAHMAQALRVISIQRGYDPGEFCLFPFGGAAGLHMCAIAKLMGMKQILVPVHAGTLSAQGMLYAPIGHMASRSLCIPWSESLSQQLATEFSQLRDHASQLLQRSGIQAQREDRWLELRYQGQSSTISLPWHDQTEAVASQFEQQHQQRYGFTLSNHAIELVTLRVWVYQDMPNIELTCVQQGQDIAEPIDYCDVYGESDSVPVYLRTQLANKQSLRGPCVILEASSTLYIESEWTGEVLASGHIRLQLTTDYP